MKRKIFIFYFFLQISCNALSVRQTRACRRTEERKRRCEKRNVFIGTTDHHHNGSDSADYPGDAVSVGKKRLLDSRHRVLLHRGTERRVLGPRPLLNNKLYGYFIFSTFLNKNLYGYFIFIFFHDPKQKSVWLLYFCFFHAPEQISLRLILRFFLIHYIVIITYHVIYFAWRQYWCKNEWVYNLHKKSYNNLCIKLAI